jgi:putative aldouronate transport system substrate-binding protein
MCAFVYDDSDLRLVIENGKLVPVYTKPEYKEGLAYLRKLSAEKLLDPQSFTITSSADLRKLGENEAAQMLGAVPGLYPGDFQSMAGERHKDYDPVPPLKGPKGVQLSGYFPNTATIGTFAITKACKCPEIPMRWIDWFHTTEGAVRSRIGREGFEWRKANPGELGLDGQQAEWKKLTAINEQQNYFWGQVSIPQMFVHSKQGTDPDPYSATGLEGRLYNATELYKPYRPKEIVPPMWIQKADLSRYAQLQTEVNTYVNQSIVRFISGELNIDTEWENYTKQLDKMGMPEYINILQKAYDSKYKK